MRNTEEATRMHNFTEDVLHTSSLHKIHESIHYKQRKRTNSHTSRDLSIHNHKQSVHKTSSSYSSFHLSSHTPVAFVLVLSLLFTQISMWTKSIIKRREKKTYLYVHYTQRMCLLRPFFSLSFLFSFFNLTYGLTYAEVNTSM